MFNYFFSDIDYKNNKKLALQIIYDLQNQIDYLEKEEENLTYNKFSKKDYDNIQKNKIIIIALKKYYGL